MNKNLAKILFAEGTFFSILGIIILLSPQPASLLTIILISLILITAGIYKLANSILTRKENETPWLGAFIGLICLSAGIYMKLNPFFSLMLFSAMIIIYLILDGLYSILTAINYKNISKIWIIGIMSGILQLGLAIFILLYFPKISLITVGILIGANMFAGGMGLIILSLGLNKISNPN